MSNKPALMLSPKVKATDRYRKYLEIASIFLPKPLTKVEIDILDELYHYSRGELTTDSRKHVRETLGKTSQQINNYILAMRAAGIIIENMVNKSLLIPIPELDGTEEKPKFILHIEMLITL